MFTRLVFVLTAMFVYHVNAQTCADGSNDIQILPSCTLKGLLTGIDTCTATLMAGYPYSAIQTCRTNIDNTISCVVTQARTCAVGSCDFVLDVIPEVGPLIPQYIMNYTEGINSVSSILDLFLPANDPTRILIESYITTFACPVTRTVPAGLTDILDSLMLNFTAIQNPICDQQVLEDVYNLGIVYMNAFYTSTTSAQLCIAGNSFRTSALNIYDSRCNQAQIDALIDSLTAQIPAEFQSLVPQIDVAIAILENYIRTTQLPGCNSGGIISKSNWSILMCIVSMLLIKNWL